MCVFVLLFSLMALGLRSLLTPSLPSENILAKIAWLKLSGKFPMDMRIPPLKIKILLESNLLKSRILVRRLAVLSLVVDTCEWMHTGVCTHNVYRPRRTHAGIRYGLQVGGEGAQVGRKAECEWWLPGRPGLHSPPSKPYFDGSSKMTGSISIPYLGLFV